MLANRKFGDEGLFELHRFGILDLFLQDVNPRDQGPR